MSKRKRTIHQNPLSPKIGTDPPRPIPPVSLDPQTEQQAIEATPVPLQKRRRQILPLRPGKLLGIAATIVGTISALNSLGFDVSIQPTSSLDSKNPFETRFIVTNESPYAISDVGYACQILDLRVRERRIDNPSVQMVTLIPATTDELPAHGHYSVYCGSNQPPEAGNLTAAAIQITVSYRRPLGVWRRFGGGTFWGKRAADGTFSWFPAGRLTTAQEIEQRPPDAAFGEWGKAH